MKRGLLLATAVMLCSVSLSFAQTDVKIKQDKDGDVKIKDGDKTIKKDKDGDIKVKDGKTKTKTKATESMPPTAAGWSRTTGGLQYRMVKDVPGTNMPKLGDNVEMHINTHIGDSSLFNSRKLNNNQPVPFQIMPPSFKGDLVEGFML